MSDTILTFCEECGEQFDYLPDGYSEKICDSCAEEGVNHYDETVAHREWANQDLLLSR